MHYDPLVGKLICFAPGEGESAFQASRERSIAALDEYRIDGVSTNKSVLRNILKHPEFVENDILLSFMVRHSAELNRKDREFAKGGFVKGGLAIYVLLLLYHYC